MSIISYVTGKPSPTIVAAGEAGRGAPGGTSRPGRSLMRRVLRSCTHSALPLSRETTASSLSPRTEFLSKNRSTPPRLSSILTSYVILLP